MSAEDFEPFKEIRAERQAKRRARLAHTDTSGWGSFTEYHFYRYVAGGRVDWWPSSNKWQFQGKYFRGALPQRILDLIAASPPTV